MSLRYLFALLISLCFFRITAYADCLPPQYTYTNGVTHQSGSLSWSYYGNGLPTYQLQWRVAGDVSWNTAPVLTSSAYSLTGLANNTNYEWKVRSICAAGDTSVFTSPLVFQTKCNAPTSPTVSIIGYQSVLLSWYSSVYNATYEVQWRSAGTETWTVVSNLTNTSLTLSGLSSNTFIEWKVRAMCSETASSDFLTGPLFQAQCLVPTNTRSTLTSPDAAELKWDSPLSNARFDLQWRQAGAPAWNVVSDISATEYILTGLANETAYEWQVRMACSATDKSDFTEVQLVRTRCPTPTGLAVSSSMYNSATLQWTSAAPVNLQWRPAGTPAWANQPGVRAPYLLTGLTTNTIYEWRVQATCSGTAVSAYTPVQSLATRCATPVSPYAYADEKGGLQLSWGYSTGDLFEVQWRVVGTTNWSTATNITNTYYALTDLIANATYEWGVRQVCSATEKSDYIMGPLIQTRCGAPSYITVDKLTNTSVDLTWSDAGPGSYEVQWRPVNTTDWTIISGITTTRYTLTGLPTNASYEWRLRKVCSGSVMSAFSYNYGFTLRCEQPSYLYTSDVAMSSATLSWSGYYSYAPYTVQYRAVGSPDWISIGNITTTQYALTGLVVNKTYEWRVQSNCSPGGSTNFSTSQTFQTQCGQPFTGLNVQKIDVSSAELHWMNNASNNNLYEIQYRDVSSPNWITIRPEGAETDPYFGVAGYNAEKQYMLYGLTPGKTYAWRIRILCTPTLYSDFANGGAFTTTCTIPPNAYAYQQANTTIQINWTATTLAPTFELQWRAVGATTWNVVNGLTNSYYTLTGLSPGASYEYRIRQLCQNGIVGEFSPLSTVTLRCLNVATITPVILSGTSFRLDWNYYTSTDAPVRLHELQYRVYGTSTWTTVTGIVGTTYSLTGLVTGATYEYQIRVLCQPGIASDYQSGRYQLSCPATSVYVSNVGATSVNLSLSQYTTNQSYVLQWRIAGTTAWSTLSVPASSYTLTGLSANTIYEWRSASDCGGGFLSDFSAVKTFQTSCPSVQNLSISNVGSNRAQLNWSVYGLATGATYNVQYRVSGDVVWATVSGFVTTAASLTGLLNNVTYECRIQTVCVGGSTSGFSNVGSFRTQCANPPYGSTSQITTQSALITWPATIENAPIELQWKPATGNAAWTEVTGITGSTYTLTGLTPGTSYVARYRSVCSTTDRSSYSAGTIGFQTLSVSVTTPPTAYADSVSAQFARIRWAATANTNYVLQWREKNGAWNTTGLLTATTYLLPNLTTNTSYEIRVGVVGTDNVVDYGTINSFTTSCPRIANAATSVVTSRSALLTWSDPKFPVSVQWRVGGTINWNSVTGVVGGRYTLTGLANNTIYEWRVQTICSADVFSATYPLKFQTLCRMPSTAYTQSVASGAAQLIWSNSGPEYSVQYRLVGAATWTTINSVTATAYTLTGLATNTAYEWAVATVCEPGTTTAYTSPVQFTTQCSLPTNLYVSAGSSDREQLTWTGIEAGYQLQWRVQGSSAWNTESSVTAPYTLTGLTTGVTYEWRIRSECSVATDGPFVSGYSFTVQCPGIYSENIRTTGITSSAARLTWTMIALTTYQLRWRVLGTTTWTNSPGNVMSPYPLAGLTNNTIYEWQLRSECQSNYSSSALFQTICTAPGSPRTEVITTTSAQLRWTDSGENVAYELQWRVAGTSNWTSIPNINGTSYSLTGLTTTTTYEWQVRSQCTGGSVFQVTASFKTADDCVLGMTTVRAGSWDDPTVWSCGRVPTGIDRVQLNHILTIPNNYTANVLTIRYEAGARLTFGVGSTIKMGQ